MIIAHASCSFGTAGVHTLCVDTTRVRVRGEQEHLGFRAVRKSPNGKEEEEEERKLIVDLKRRAQFSKYENDSLLILGICSNGNRLQKETLPLERRGLIASQRHKDGLLSSKRNTVCVLVIASHIFYYV